jgi:hypothetical protein
MSIKNLLIENIINFLLIVIKKFRQFLTIYFLVQIKGVATV